MIPDRLQYFLKHFWNDQKLDQIWTLGPRIYHQKIFNEYKENYGSSLTKYYFHISNINFRQTKITSTVGVCTKLHANVFGNVLLAPPCMGTELESVRMSLILYF